jgi:hypothetical protein
VIVSPASAHLQEHVKSDVNAEQVYADFASVMLENRPGEPFVYPPTLYEPGLVEELSFSGRGLATLIAEMPERAFGDDVQARLRFLGVDDRVEASLLTAAFENPHLRSSAVAFVRPDILATASGLRAVEINVAAPIGGITHHGPYVDAFRASKLSEVVGRLGYKVDVPDIAKYWLDTFESHLRGGRSAARVFLAIAESTDPNLGAYYYRRVLEDAGFVVVTGLVASLAFDRKGVSFEGHRIDVVLTMYTWFEACLYVPPALTAQLTALDANGSLDLVGSPVSALFDNKVNLELLTSLEYRHLLDKAERAFVDQYLSPTFRLTNETFAQALLNQENLVCKPASAFAGKGLVLGWTVNRAEWHRTLMKGIQGQKAYVCQERVQAEDVYQNAQGEAISVCFGPIMLNGTYAGTFTRELPTRAGPVVNAGAGASPAALLRAEATLFSGPSPP